MGCTQTKIENEEAVSRCKGRKQHMKEAVAARNAYAAAHVAFAMALKNTGAALSDYAPGESHLPHPLPNNPPTAPESVLRPPPLPDFGSAVTLPPLSRAASMPEIPLSKHRQPSTADPILEEDEVQADNEGSAGGSSRRGRGRSENKINRPSEQDTEDEDGPRPPPSPPAHLVRNITPTPSSIPDMPKANDSSWDYFFPPENPRLSLAEADEDRMGLEATDGKPFHARFGDSEKPTELEKPVAEAVEKDFEPSPMATAVHTPKTAVMIKVKPNTKDVPSTNLVTIFRELDDHFLRASESAHGVSVMLEANRLHYHSNFADNRGHIDHSARVMRVITWNRSFRGLPNEDGMADDVDSEKDETHATILDKLLAWEKKLYDEVKALELMKFEYQKKVTSLNKHQRRGTNSDVVEKAKAAVSHLHTRYIVDMQSLDSTVTEIERLRDGQLYPRLLALVDGLAKMWGTMREHHELQARITKGLKYLDRSHAPNETSQEHYDHTVQLWNVVQEWHTQFGKLLLHQKDYIKSLKGWLCLNLIPIESSLKEKVSSPRHTKSPPIQSLIQVWHDSLEDPMNEAATSSISSFAAVVGTIVQQQEEELKLRRRCDEIHKELLRKRRQFEDWKQKHGQREGGEEGDLGLVDAETQERMDVVEAVKKRWDEVKAEYEQQCRYVRDKSLMTLKSSLPDLFQRLTEFAGGYYNIYRRILQLQNPMG